MNTSTTRSDIPIGYTRDATAQVLSFRYSSGGWYEYTRDAKGQVLTFRDSSGYEYGYTRDATGLELTFRDSSGFWYEHTRDATGRELTFRDFSGFWQTLAIDPDYTLRYSPETSVYWAGCFKGTLDQAVDRWAYRSNDRAMMFTVAILNHLESL